MGDSAVFYPILGMCVRGCLVRITFVGSFGFMPQLTGYYLQF